MKYTVRLLFASVFLVMTLYSCQDDKLDEVAHVDEVLHVHTDAFGRTIETVEVKNIPFLIDFIESQHAGYLNQNGNRSDDGQANPFGTVDLNYI